MPTATPIKVPVRDFVHPGTGGRVTVHGMLHAAQESFFAELKQTLHAAHEQGAHIHLEGVRRPGPDELDGLPEAPREYAKTLMRVLDADNDRFKAAGLVLQREHLAPEPGWQRHDIAIVRAVDVYGSAVMQQFATELKSLEAMSEGYSPDVMRAMLLQSLAIHIAVAAGEKDIEVVFGGVDRYMCALRESIALGAVDVEFAKDPAAQVNLVWGAAHLKGFTAGLVERGFEEKETRWVTAIDPETLPALT